MLWLNTARDAERLTADELRTKANVPGYLRARLAGLPADTLIDATWTIRNNCRVCLDAVPCTDASRPARPYPIDNPWTGD